MLSTLPPYLEIVWWTLVCYCDHSTKTHISVLARGGNSARETALQDCNHFQREISNTGSAASLKTCNCLAQNGAELPLNPTHHSQHVDTQLY